MCVENVINKHNDTEGKKKRVGLLLIKFFMGTSLLFNQVLEKKYQISQDRMCIDVCRFVYIIYMRVRDLCKIQELDMLFDRYDFFWLRI